MPFIQRNWKGEITGLFACSQAGYAEEFLPDNAPEVLAFEEAHPAPALPPMTSDEIKQSGEYRRALEREHESIRNAVWAFNAAFSELEITFSTLLYSAINLPNSQVAYAIYYSPAGFDTRKSLVNDIIKQIIQENQKLEPLSEMWPRLYSKIDSIRKMRNDLAHGHPITISINGKNHARLTAPAFDVLRVSRKITAKQIPGLTSSDIFDGAKKTRWLIERLDDVNRIFSTYHDVGNPTLPDKFLALEVGLNR